MKRFLLSLAIAASVSGCAMQQSFSAGDYGLTPKAMSLLASDFIPPLKREIPRSHQLELVEVSPEFTPLLESELRKAGYAVTVVKRPNKQSPDRWSDPCLCLPDQDGLSGHAETLRRKPVHKLWAAATGTPRPRLGRSDELTSFLRPATAPTRTGGRSQRRDLS
ncbi:MAG: hypothetical protein R8F89_12400 [Roseobacter sp.]|nr:hypothetical protein [Roseobacter sp.]MDW3182777.1 hypothetical protein [Roseobacter sp.]